MRMPLAYFLRVMKRSSVGSLPTTGVLKSCGDIGQTVEGRLTPRADTNHGQLKSAASRLPRKCVAHIQSGREPARLKRKHWRFRENGTLRHLVEARNNGWGGREVQLNIVHGVVPVARVEGAMRGDRAEGSSHRCRFSREAVDPRSLSTHPLIGYAVALGSRTTTSRSATPWATRWVSAFFTSSALRHRQSTRAIRLSCGAGTMLHTDVHITKKWRSTSRI